MMADFLPIKKEILTFFNYTYTNNEVQCASNYKRTKNEQKVYTHTQSLTFSSGKRKKKKNKVEIADTIYVIISKM